MTNNMTEVNQSKIKLFIGWVVSHAVSIGLICIGLALFLSSCHMAKADGYDYESNLQSDLAEYCPSIDFSDVYVKLHNNSYNSNTVVDGARLETDGFIYYFLSYGNTPMFPCVSYDVTQNVLDICNSSFSVPYYSISTTYRSENNRLANYCAIIDKSFNGFVLMYCSVDGEISYNYNAYNLSDGSSGNIYFYYFNWPYQTGTWFTVNNNNINGEIDLDDVINYNCSSDFYFCNTSSNLYYLTEGEYSQFVEDNRLKITTVNDIYGQKNLFIDIREFVDDFPISDSSGSSNWLDNDTLILTLVRDNIPEEISLNTSNSNINSKYIFETPYSFFNILEDEELYISDVSFSISGSGQSVPLQTESYNILCEYWLNQIYTKPEQADIPRDSDVDGTKLTQVEYDKITNQVNFSDGYYSPLGGGGNELVVPYGYNVLYVTITGSRTLSSIINEIVTDNYVEILLASGDPMTDIELSVYLAKEITSSITGITSTSDAENLIKEYIKNNYYTNMFDIVVYYWAPDSSLGEVDVMYYYLTESGRLRGISQILADVYRESNQISVNTKATYEFLYDKLNDFENMTLEAIWGDSPFSVFNSLDKLDNDMLSSVSRIIEAMPMFTPYDDHDIVYELGVLQGLLETIIENQDSPHDGYTKYISWVKNYDDLDGFGNWSESVLSTFKNIYSFFNYRQDINVMETGLQSYTYYVDEFVRMLLGNTESDLDVKKRYYMSIFDNTYDIHNINGGGS